MQINPYLKLMADKQASDLFFSTGAPVNIKIEGKTSPVIGDFVSIFTVSVVTPPW